jgi:hypothetical protein
VEKADGEHGAAGCREDAELLAFTLPHAQHIPLSSAAAAGWMRSTGPRRLFPSAPSACAPTMQRGS